jgi:hypothetical protein
MLNKGILSTYGGSDSLDLGLLGGGLVGDSGLLLSGLALLLLVVASGDHLGSDLGVSLVKTFISINLNQQKPINKIASNLQIEFWSQLSWFQLVSMVNSGVRHQQGSQDILTLFFPILVEWSLF